MLARSALVLAAVLLAPAALAQHEHMGTEGMAVVLHDGPDGGRAVVGGLTHFGFALLDAKGVPVVHQNAQFLVALDNVTVFATNDTHEYDGLFGLDVVFAHAGHYRVEAMSGKMAMGTFEGDAVEPVNETVAKVVFKRAPDALPDASVSGTLDVQGPDGRTIPHTDAILEWRDAQGRLAGRGHFHVHDAPIAFLQAFPASGDYTLHVTAYKAVATGRTTDVQAVVADFPVSVTGLRPPTVQATPPVSGAPPVMEPAGPTATKDGLTLYGMFDPQNQVTVGFPIRLSGLVEGNDSRPKPHVDFKLEIQGPYNVAVASSTLHEYDGHFEHLFVPQVPGFYDAYLTASDGKTNLTVRLEFQALPPVAPLAASSGGGVGPATLAVLGLDKAKAGEPVELTFSAMAPSGPVQHSEVDVSIAQKGKPAAYAFKLHTHESGLTKAIVVFPEAGDWTITVDALPTDYPPVVFQGPDGVGKAVVFHAKVAPSAGLPAGAAGLDASPKTVPDLGVAGFALLALVALARRR